ncbi:MAG: DUF2933 domain-containing protein [Anaerolineae bacterium]|jgi:hypothetical protein|nr:DUF2933 domain-containing protein [Anaerolineae bacterium]
MTRKHLFLMAIGCLMPLAALGAIFFLDVQVSTIVWFGLFLLCPAAHLLMMRGHMGHGVRQGTYVEHDGNN